MYLISSRYNVKDGKRFSNSDAVLQMTESGRPQNFSKEKLLRQACSKKVLVLIHGFNNSMHDVLGEYAAIEEKHTRYFADAYDCIIGYIWPGGESELDYFLAKQHSETAGARFHYWLNLLSRTGCTIDIMGHSMAALVGYHTLKTPSHISVRNVFSFGAAISQNTFSEKSRLLQINDRISGLYIFHTRNDGILKYGFRLVEWRDALGYSGPGNHDDITGQFAKTVVIDCSKVVRNHTAYKYSKSVFRFIAKILAGKKVKQFLRLQPDVNEVYKQVLKPVFN